MEVGDVVVRLPVKSQESILVKVSQDSEGDVYHFRQDLFGKSWFSSFPFAPYLQTVEHSTLPVLLGLVRGDKLLVIGRAAAVQQFDHLVHERPCPVAAARASAGLRCANDGRVGACKCALGLVEKPSATLDPANDWRLKLAQCE